jgi:recombination associated protein RdgC
VEFLLMDKDTPAEGESANPGEQFDIDFTLMTGELAALLSDLAKALGEQEQKQAAAA